MTLTALIARYGLIAVLIGAGIEGEATVVGAGLLAHEGILDVRKVAVAGSIGSFAADQLLFLVGRLYRDHPRVKRLLERPVVEQVMRSLKKHAIGFMFGFRFLYGLRTISPIAIGTTQVRASTFFAVNFVAAAIWGILFTSLGYIGGQAIERLLGDIDSIGKIIAIGAILLALLWVLNLLRRRFHG